MVVLLLCRLRAGTWRTRRWWDEGLIPRAPRLGGGSSPGRPREFLLDGRRRAGGIPRTTCSRHSNHPHRRAESLPVVKLSVLFWGQVGRLVQSRRGFDFFRSKEAQKETLCSLKISGTTGKKQRHCIKQGNHFQVIKTCC
ncbi:small membrane A-kinase anchor protein isoform X1 [Athene noctua]|uniref:small membrane A-kinase anchor protein isoform X1 n=1 Tax=Athene noctua TaxID=126797 RepID=UPI003EBB9F85